MHVQLLPCYRYMMQQFRTISVSIVWVLLLSLSTTTVWGQTESHSSVVSDTQTPPQVLSLTTDLLPDVPLGSDSNAPASVSYAIRREPIIVQQPVPPQPKPNWRGLSKDTLQFLLVMNSFRLATEQGTRDGLTQNPFFSGYAAAVSNLHGWDDGDPFYVNYIGHPMQGAVSNFIWSNRDTAYERDHFGWNNGYVKLKLRGAAYAYFLSLMFEIGPISEASIGQIQQYHPQQGFVDHVVTPVVGTMWSVGEDSIDNYFIRYIEEHTDNRALKILARSGLNPARSFANLMGRRYPWYRSNRPAPNSGESYEYYEPVAKNPVNPPPGIGPFQFNIHMETRTYFGKNASPPCIGGGTEVGFRLADAWQLMGEVTGCKQTGMQPNFTGDSLTYAIGPQWTATLSSRWVTHARVLVGGNKVSQEQVIPALRNELNQLYADKNVFPPLANQYIRDYDNNALALVGGTAFDYKLSRALLFRSAVDYSHTWNHDINNLNYRDSLRVSSGLVLNMGTW